MKKHSLLFNYIWHSIRDNQRKALFVLLTMIWLVLAFLGINNFSGSAIIYSTFSCTAFLLLYSAQTGKSYVYFFFAIYIFLGFWAKLISHLLLKYPFVEPTGGFIGLASDWNDVLLTATVGILGILAAHTTWRFRRQIFKDRNTSEETPIWIPIWYPRFRTYIWSILCIACVGTCLINMIYGIHQIGLAPRTIWQWPLNALVAWGLNIGLATFICVCMYWDFTLKRNSTLYIYCTLLEATLSGISVLSRSVYIFHSLPQYFSCYKLGLFKTWSKTKILILIIFFILGLSISVAVVSAFRNVLYQTGDYQSTAYVMAQSRLNVIEAEYRLLVDSLKTLPTKERSLAIIRLKELEEEIARLKAIMQSEKLKIQAALNAENASAQLLANEFNYQITSGANKTILQLSVDRWIGLEGLMAVQSYEKKDMQLLLTSLTEKSIDGKADTFQKISNSIYLKVDSPKFRFGALPGIVGFLYYSGNKLIVGLGMFCLTLLLLSIEAVMLRLTGNPIICSLYGAGLASNLAQFGGVPRQLIPYYIMLGIGIGMVWLVNNHKIQIKLKNIVVSHKL